MSELQAAVDRLRRLKGDIASAGYCYMASIYPNGGYIEDVQMLADTYLAEHPKDDADHVSWAWLVAVGCEDRNDDLGLCLPRSDGGYVIQVEINGGEWEASLAEVGGDVAWILCKIPTKRHVRRLCAALGIELKSA